ncbi:VCBS repeat-containing protein [Polyangium sp. y55x31]|uniref:FG-GAP repeat domain-containing protein n=1 Tax=Polyangium sp. y55x31 TaxID=3042688 RepID=UPI002482D55B|nr:VCBS repeat-containing protein [Polyangium sp. y55x31]MDI1480135.1 VCBS repeat-containing protein [Polyangium sp. y55x31]
MHTALFALALALVPTYTISPRPLSVAGMQLGDIDGDGELDVVLAHGGNPLMYGVSVLLNRGSSSLSQPRSYRLSDNGGTGLRIADFNEDQHLDLVVMTLGADGMRSLDVLLGHGEDGFGAPQLVAPNEKVNGIEVGDFNADGHRDIVVGSSSVEGDAPLVILFGRGDGTFTSVEYRGKYSLRNLAAGDMNGDGVVDIVAEMYEDPDEGATEWSVAVFLNDGTGKLAAPLRHRVPWRYWKDLALLDANRDGHLDVALIEPYENGVIVLRGAGDGKFGEFTRHATGRGAVSLAVGDVDRDGFSDLVTANEEDKTITVLLLGASGSPPKRWELPLGDRPVAVALGNMDRDAGLEIVSAGETGRITVVGFREP